MKISIYIIALLIFFLTACGKAEENRTEKPAEEDHILSGHMKALEKAKEAQAIINEKTEKRQKEIDEAMGKK